MLQHIFQGAKVINAFQIIYYIHHCLAEKKPPGNFQYANI